MKRLDFGHSECENGRGKLAQLGKTMATPEWNSLDRFEETFPVFDCAFLDILGYKERVAGYFNHDFNLFGRINRALDTVVTCKTLASPLLDMSDLTVEIVSDSIIIMQPHRARGLGTILLFSCWFSANLSYEGLLIRGGIARGRHSRKKTTQGFDFLASEALQKAYLLEHERAKSPRILIDEDLIAGLSNEDKGLIIRERDEFILHFAHHVINREGLNVNDVHAEMEELQHEKNNNPDVRVQAKYQWLLDYYHWTISHNRKLNSAVFAGFSSGEDRGFAAMVSQ